MGQAKLDGPTALGSPTAREGQGLVGRAAVGRAAVGTAAVVAAAVMGTAAEAAGSDDKWCQSL